MVDLLWHDRRRLRRSGARASNYVNANYENEEDRRRKKRFGVVIVYDPLPVDKGGLRAGAQFQFVDWNYTLSEKTVTENIIVEVLDTRINKDRATKWLPGYYRCVTLRVDISKNKRFVAPQGGRFYMDMVRLDTVDQFRTVIYKRRQRNGGQADTIGRYNDKITQD